jgi:hypothetical protein
MESPIACDQDGVMDRGQEKLKLDLCQPGGTADYRYWHTTGQLGADGTLQKRPPCILRVGCWELPPSEAVLIRYIRQTRNHNHGHVRSTLLDAHNC